MSRPSKIRWLLLLPVSQMCTLSLTGFPFFGQLQSARGAEPCVYVHAVRPGLPCTDVGCWSLALICCLATLFLMPPLGGAHAHAHAHSELTLRGNPLKTFMYLLTRTLQPRSEAALQHVVGCVASDRQAVLIAAHLAE